MPIYFIYNKNIIANGAVKKHPLGCFLFSRSVFNLTNILSNFGKPIGSYMNALLSFSFSTKHVFLFLQENTLIKSIHNKINLKKLKKSLQNHVKTDIRILTFLTLSSRGLGHRPFTAVTRVRISLGSPRRKPSFGGFFYKTHHNTILKIH